MSSMLEQAIIDAKQLKETAQQSAEEAVIEKYQSEIREAVEKILEQEEEVAEEVEMTVDDQGDLAVLENLPAAQTTPVDEIVTIDLDKLEEMMAEEMEEGAMDPSVMEGHEEVALEIDALTEDLEELDEEIELDEADLQSMLEEDDLLEVEIEPDDLATLVKNLQEEMLEEDEKESDKSAEPLAALEEKEEKLAAQAGDPEKVEPEDFKNLKKGTRYTESKKSDMLQKENKSLLKEQTVLSKKLQLLESKIDKYDTVITKLKNKLEESNLANARLLYQNRVLDSISLNERQKDKIVEAIGNAKTVEEAKIIYETLQSAVGSASKRTKKPESLNEVVTRNSSAFMPRKRETKKEDSFAKRMKILAGLNK